MHAQHPKQALQEMKANLKDAKSINEAFGIMELLSNIPDLASHLKNGSGKKSYNYLSFICGKKFDLSQHLVSGRRNHSRLAAALRGAFLPEEISRHGFAEDNILNLSDKDVIVRGLILWAVLGGLEYHYNNDTSAREKADKIIAEVEPDKVPTELAKHIDTLSPFSRGGALRGHLDELMPLVEEIISKTNKIELMDEATLTIDKHLSESTMNDHRKIIVKDVMDSVAKCLDIMDSVDFVNLLGRIEQYTISPTRKNATQCADFGDKLSERYGEAGEMKKLCDNLLIVSLSTPKNTTTLTFFDRSTAQPVDPQTPPDSPKPKG